MRSKYSVKLKSVAEEHGLTPLTLSKNYETALVTTADVNRPAMQLTGFYNYFDPRRIQIMGRVESTYLDTLSTEERLRTFERFMQYDICALVICHGVPAFPECIEMARKFEIYGEGLFLMGDSGIGKSETALELIKRGHRLIADDAVEIRRINRDTLMGSAPAMIRYYMEVRGIGVINVRHLYGMGAVKPETKIDLVVQMESWEEGKAYDRLGLTNETATILGMTLPQVTIPVRPGRNLAVIMELAAMNNRQKKMGYNAAEALAAEHDAAIDMGLF